MQSISAALSTLIPREQNRGLGRGRVRSKNSLIDSRCRGSEKPGFLKAQPTGFFGFWALLDFRIFLFERRVGKLVG